MKNTKNTKQETVKKNAYEKNAKQETVKKNASNTDYER